MLAAIDPTAAHRTLGPSFSNRRRGRMPMQMTDTGHDDSGNCCVATVPDLRPPVSTRRPRPSEKTRCSRATEADLRQAYFAHTGAVVSRYGVRFERLIEHL